VLVIKALLQQVLEKEREAMSVDAKSVTSASNGIEILEIANDWYDETTSLINDNIPSLLVNGEDFLDSHDDSSPSQLHHLPVIVHHSER
jgi:hypothetical protein